MKLVRLSSQALVNPDDISSVEVPQWQEHIIIRMKSGQCFTMEPRYGESRTAALDRLEADVAAAGGQYAG